MSEHRTAPVASTRMPGGIPFIIGNEAAERFSFYGMKGILVIFMTKHLLDSAGQPNYMTDEDAKAIYHLFTAAAYFFPIIGSLLADIVLGKYRTIIVLSLGYCIGHACLALGDTGLGTGVLEPRTWLFVGLVFIAIGAGGIKPCVSAHVGDQFGRQNQHLVSKIFSWFYFSINVGAAASTLLTPVLLVKFGPWAAFGLPGVLMALATFVFWLGRNRFVHVPPSGLRKFTEETFSRDGLRALLNLSPIFLIFIPMFWALFDQTGSAWVLQADRMDRHFFGMHWLPSQVQAVNPILILILIPTFAYGVYPMVDRVFRMTPLRKMSIGFFMTAIAFTTSSLIETEIRGGEASYSSVSPVAGWGGQTIIDGDADGLGWSSSPKESLPQDVTIRLRERQRWEVSSVEIDPSTITGPPDTDAKDEIERRKAMTDAEREGLENTPDTANWAQRVTILVRDADAGEADFREVATLDLTQTPGRQGVSFDPVSATHVMVRVESNWGGDRAKIGEVRVLTTDAPIVAGVDEESWPDVASLGFQPSIGWQFLAYILLTAAEVMVSITSLEFAYTQAPKKMKSFLMGIYFLGVSLGNFFTAGVNVFIQNDDGSVKLAGAEYYWFFTGLMAITAVIFVFYATLYRGRTFVQGEETDSG